MAGREQSLPAISFAGFYAEVCAGLWEASRERVPAVVPPDHRIVLRVQLWVSLRNRSPLLKSLKSLTVRILCVVICSWALLASPLHAVTWFPLGPYGGDARSFAADPLDSKHLYLGTANGWIYESHNGGATWGRLSQLGKRNDLVIDQILPDARHPQRLVVGAWIADHPDGGIFISEDGGRNWTDVAQMHGESVLSLAQSPSDPNLMIAGTLKGVFRSGDSGVHWNQISPLGSTEIHEVESLAIDPHDPQVIYAGTWHLPWKTVDGGAHWVNIKQGIIEDSDVFSIVVDPAQPQIVYASACSGIYKSTNAAMEFKKVQGIPSTARRTRKLEQDPEHLQTVYAGTTEGLYRTLDGGHLWDRLTGSDVIVNDVYVDPHDSNHVLLATDRGGVLRSEDFAASFHESNTGFSARQVVAYASDPRHPAVVYAGVVNDKEAGGVFQSLDGGVRWRQQSAGLGGRDVYSLAPTPAGVMLAGTTHGIFRLQDGLWTDSGTLLKGAGKDRKTPRAGGRSTGQSTMDAVVYTLVPDGNDSTYAGTSEGLLRSSNDGIGWSPVSTLDMSEVRFFALHKDTLLAAGLKRMEVSTDGGVKWSAAALPAALTQVAAVAVDDERTLWVGGREGVFYSSNNGVSWKQVHDLVTPQVDGIYFDPREKRMLLTTAVSTMIFSVQLPDHKVSYWDTGWKLRFARPVGDHLLGVTLYDGIVVQPKMVDSGFGSTHASEGK
jgi:photosystem II stability/assembly factor-like uncharacterized protein